MSREKLMALADEIGASWSEFRVEDKWQLQDWANQLRTLAASAESAEVVAWQFQGRDGDWYNFLSDTHRKDTYADGTWPMRRLIVHPGDRAATQEGSVR